jgi:hypothetical protein
MVCEMNVWHSPSIFIVFKFSKIFATHREVKQGVKIGHLGKL